MITIHTPHGKNVEIITLSELRSPVDTGERVRAYCHIHGSDHQRSLSIDKATGWGHCFNAACAATVLVAEWNRPLARYLLRAYYQGLTSTARPDYVPPGNGHSFGTSGGRDEGQARGASHPYPSSPASTEMGRLCVVQPMLLPPPRAVPQWQQDELDALLDLDGQMRAALVYAPRARAYLRERGIPLRVALATGVGFLPASLVNKPEMRGKRRLLRRWVERIVFPLVSPEGKGYIGRSLWRWQPGMNESRHKEMLEQPGGQKRWIKTAPAGWFCVEADQLARHVILVEGAFDRLTLLAAGFPASQVIALVGTAAPCEWFPAHVRAVTLALDADEGGQEAAYRLAEHLTQDSLDVQLCAPRSDNLGKDWNERWQHAGRRGLSPLFEMLRESRPA